MKLARNINAEMPTVYEFRNDTYSVVTKYFGTHVGENVFPVQNFRQLNNIEPKQAIITARLLKWLVLGNKLPEQGVFFSQSPALTKEIKVVPLSEASGTIIAANNDMDAVISCNDIHNLETTKAKIKFVDPTRLRSFRRVADGMIVTRTTNPNHLITFLYNFKPVTNFIVVQPTVTVEPQETI